MVSSSTMLDLFIMLILFTITFLVISGGIFKSCEKRIFTNTWKEFEIDNNTSIITQQPLQSTNNNTELNHSLSSPTLSQLSNKKRKLSGERGKKRKSLSGYIFVKKIQKDEELSKQLENYRFPPLEKDNSTSMPSSSPRKTRRSSSRIIFNYLQTTEGENTKRMLNSKMIYYSGNYCSLVMKKLQEQHQKLKNVL
ncbi:hypothetical protein ABK040_003733 [Willaertia magna]